MGTDGEDQGSDQGAIVVAQPVTLARSDDAQPSVSPAAVYVAGLTSPASRRTMANALDQIARLLNPGATALDFPWWRLRYEHTQVVRTQLIGKFGPRTVNRMLAAMRGVLNVCGRLRVQRAGVEVPLLSAQDLHDALAFKGVPQSEYSEASAGRMLTPDEKKKLRAAATDLRDRAVLELDFATGLRRFEIAALDVAHWDRSADELAVKGKGRKLARLPVLPSAAIHLDAWLAVRGPVPGPLFCRYDTKHRPQPASRLSVNGVQRIFAELEKAAGVAHFTTHDVRRTLISELWDADVDASTVQKLARHANMQTSASYDRRGQRAKLAGLQKWQKKQEEEEK